MTENVRDDANTETEPTQEEMRERVIQLAFGGDLRRYEEFCDVLRETLPEGTQVVLRGSSITGVRWKDGSPFDHDGPGTSDLDLTLVGDKIHDFYILDGYYIPGLHSKPLSDKDPDIAPDLIPLRERLQGMVNRPVNIQATRELVMDFREDVMGQPALTMIEEVRRSGGE